MTPDNTSTYHPPEPIPIGCFRRALANHEAAIRELGEAELRLAAASTKLGQYFAAQAKSRRLKATTLAQRVGETSSAVSQRLSGNLRFTREKADRYRKAIELVVPRPLTHPH